MLVTGRIGLRPATIWVGFDMGADNTARGARLAEAWRGNWSYLVGLAFGMLGDTGAAEDALQEAYARLASTEPDQVDDARGCLMGASA